MKNSVRPGFSAITTWPRTGLTDGSGTKSRAPAPVQFTITGAELLPDGLGQRVQRHHREPPARAAQPSGQVVQVDGHGHDRRAVPPARHEAGRQGRRTARPEVAQRREPVRAGSRGPRGLGPADQPDAGARIIGQLREHPESLGAPAGHPVAVLDQMRPPDGPGHRRRGLLRRLASLDGHGQPGFRQAHRGGQSRDARPDHQHLTRAFCHPPTVAPGPGQDRPGAAGGWPGVSAIETV